jgi:hypothetical protein
VALKFSPDNAQLVPNCNDNAPTHPPNTRTDTDSLPQSIENALENPLAAPRVKS